MITTGIRFVMYSIVLYYLLLFVVPFFGIPEEHFGMAVLLLTILIQALAITASLTGVTEQILSMFYRARPLSSREAARLMPLINEVAAKTNISNLRVLYSPTSEVNAAAVGRRTLILNKGLVDKLNDEQLKAIIGHELGHLSHGDTLYGAVRYSISVIPACMTRSVLWIIAKASRMLSVSTNNSSGLWIILFALSASLLTLIAIPALVFLVDRKLLTLLDYKLSRNAEFRADNFGASVSSRDAMIGALEELEKAYGEQATTFFERLFHTHPPIAFRIDRLRESFAS